MSTPAITLWDCNIYFTALALAWVQAFVALELLVILVGAALNRVHLASGSDASIAITFVAAFCLTGVVDAWWRLSLSWIGSRRLERQRFQKDDTTLWLQRLAIAPDYYIFFTQLAVAVVLVVWF